MADDADLASDIETLERDWLIRQHRARTAAPGQATHCTTCGRPTLAGRDVCTDCAAKAAGG